MTQAEGAAAVLDKIHSSAGDHFSACVALQELFMPSATKMLI